MILSVSRRTDIPNYYCDWFFNRIKEGFVYVRNPFNARQISRIPLNPEVVDCMVFWTKNPTPMLDRLGALAGYEFYFQFTLTGYGRDVEPGLPDKRKELIPAFKRLSESVGPKRVIWRYDPIFINERYTADYHIQAFEEISRALEGAAERVVISFLDPYARIKKWMDGMKAGPPDQETTERLAEYMAQTARSRGMRICTCAELVDLDRFGICHGSCIDRQLIEELTGSRLPVKKDKNQRAECGCVESVDIGAYHTCRNGCAYCYAGGARPGSWEMQSGSGEMQPGSAGGAASWDVCSPLLGGAVHPDDRITDYKGRSRRDNQLSLFE